MLKLIVANPEIATTKIMNKVVYIDFASRGRTQIPDAKPADDIHDIDESDQLLNSLLNEMKRVLDQDDLGSFLFE